MPGIDQIHTLLIYLSAPGTYYLDNIRAGAVSNPNVPVTIVADGGAPKTVTVNQKKAGANNEASLGTFPLTAGKAVTVTVSTAGTNGHVIVDGLQLIKK